MSSSSHIDARTVRARLLISSLEITMFAGRVSDVGRSNSNANRLILASNVQ